MHVLITGNTVNTDRGVFGNIVNPDPDYFFSRSTSGKIKLIFSGISATVINKAPCEDDDDITRQDMAIFQYASELYR